MNRCPPHRTIAARQALGATALLCASLLAASATHAQTVVPTDTAQRQFPAHALRGVLKVTNPPEVLLNGKPERLSPGSRLRDTNNLIVPPHQLVGAEVRVNYTREATGLVHDVWVLTPAEAAQKRAGNNDWVQRNFRFSSEP